MSKTTMGQAHRRECGDGRICMANPAWRYRRAAGGETEHWPHRVWRSDCDGGGPGIYCGHERQAVARVRVGRREARQGSEVGLQRDFGAHNLPGKERQAICGGGCRGWRRRRDRSGSWQWRSAGRVCVAVTIEALSPAVRASTETLRREFAAAQPFRLVVI